MISLKLLFLAAFFGLGGCDGNENKKSPTTLFNELSAEQTGIDFRNQLDYTEQLNTYTYKNFYSGGGVGLGDFNNDGLVDIFFCRKSSSQQTLPQQRKFTI